MGYSATGHSAPKALGAMSQSEAYWDRTLGKRVYRDHADLGHAWLRSIDDLDDTKVALISDYRKGFDSESTAGSELGYVDFLSASDIWARLVP